MKLDRNSFLRTGMLAAAALLSSGLVACGPTLVNIDPTKVTSLEVRPAAGPKVFCPGASFQVEVLAKFADGSACSSTNRELGCQGEKDAVIDPKLVQLEGSDGKRTGKPKKFLWAPPEDVLTTADVGLTMRAWLERENEGQVQKSMVAEVDLAPVYQCLADNIFQADSSGEPGPDLNIAVTTLHTPYFADAALIRVEVDGARRYYISSAPDAVITIRDIGGNGHTGDRGQDGMRGENGRSASSDAPECTIGENGRDGQDGGPGHPGGDGGPGGRVKISFDKAAADKLRGRLVVESIGGAPGRGGDGGFGGQGGDGGSGVSGQGCSDVRGKSGRQGRQGPSGSEGRAGQAGPPPVVATAPRESLFAEEMKIIQRIESATPKSTGTKKKKKKKKDVTS